MARVVLQRHTHPDIRERLCYGWSDIDVRREYLDVDLPEVMAQYRSTIEIGSIERLYSSPLQRCSRLAADLQPLTSAHEIIFDDRLKELNFGEWESRSWDEIYQLEGSKGWFDDYINVAPPKGESFIDLLHRAESLLELLRSRGEDAIVVTHSGFIRATMAIIGRCALEEVFNDEIKYGGAIEIEL
ncbi:MAG: histidine phosphatase family protein [Rikenellaceae bacterium]